MDHSCSLCVEEHSGVYSLESGFGQGEHVFGNAIIDSDTVLHTLRQFAPA